jgi:hypothetical protein
LILGLLEYAVGIWKIFAILISLVALFLLLSLLLPGSSAVRKLAGLVARALDVLHWSERLDDYFESLIKRLKT